jgi:hypothetical protein
VPSPSISQQPRGAAPFWARWIAPVVFLTVCLSIVGFATSLWLHRPTPASKLLLPLLWVAVLIGVPLFCVAWRGLLRNARTSGGRGDNGTADPSNQRLERP